MKNFLKEAKNIFTNRKLLGMMLITIAILVLYRIGSLITLPFVNLDNKEDASSSAADIINLLGGGGLNQFSIFAMGISPYITAQIIVQLLSSDLVPALHRLSKSGEKGRKKIDMISRLVTLPFAVLQVFAVVQLMDTLKIVTFEQMTPTRWAYLMAILIAGTYFAIFLGDLITKFGIGNGISLIIAAGIISSLPYDLTRSYNAIETFSSNSTYDNIIYFIIYIAFCLLMVILVAFITGSTRKIPIQRTSQGVIGSDQLPYLPIKVNAAGVIPVIFASALISIPLTVAQILPEGSAKWLIEDYFAQSSWTGLGIYVFLVFLFTFLYSYIQTNPEQIADNLKNSGSFIPGVMPGEQTRLHINRVLTRLNWIGGPFIALVASLPYVLSNSLGIPASSALGGTGLIIMISVCIETFKAIRSASTTSQFKSLRKSIVVESAEPTVEFNDEVDNVKSTIW